MVRNLHEPDIFKMAMVSTNLFSEYLSRFAALEGPIGEPDPSNLLGDSFMEHEDWKKLGRWPETDEKDFDSMMHWKDFVRSGLLRVVYPFIYELY